MNYLTKENTKTLSPQNSVSLGENSDHQQKINTLDPEIWRLFDLEKRER